MAHKIIHGCECRHIAHAVYVQVPFKVIAFVLKHSRKKSFDIKRYTFPLGIKSIAVDTCIPRHPATKAFNT